MQQQQSRARRAQLPLAAHWKFTILQLMQSCAASCVCVRVAKGDPNSDEQCGLLFVARLRGRPYACAPKARASTVQAEDAQQQPLTPPPAH